MTGGVKIFKKLFSNDFFYILTLGFQWYIIKQLLNKIYEFLEKKLHFSEVTFKKNSGHKAIYLTDNKIFIT